MAEGSLCPVLELRCQGKVLGRYRLEPFRSLSIGRDPENPITVNDPAISRRHAEVFTLSTQRRDVVIKDLGSTNGTRVKGQRIERQILEIGDVVQLGSHELVLICP
ncbi:MAG: FHA domain-containing protein [Gammaproteobacteria bacterium]|nr:FHA domain-containing protein [Gammaproteobacteria bacterium]